MDPELQSAIVDELIQKNLNFQRPETIDFCQQIDELIINKSKLNNEDRAESPINLIETQSTQTEESIFLNQLIQTSFQNQFDELGIQTETNVCFFK